MSHANDLPATESGFFTFTYPLDDGTDRTRELAAVDGTELTLGRLSTNGVAIGHPTISRHHARIVIREGRCFLTDLGSTCGTRVNGTAVTAEAEVKPGDTFSLGAIPFTVQWRLGPALPSGQPEEPQIPAGTIFRSVEQPAPGANDGSEPARLKRLLSDISKTLVAVQDLPHVLQKVVDLVFDAVAGERAFLLLREPGQEALIPQVARHHDGHTLTDTRISSTVVNTVLRDRVAMLATDAFNDQRLDMAQSIVGLNIRSFLCAPLWNRNDVIGVLYVDNPHSRRFSEGDLDVFVALANYAAVAIEQARLAGRVLEETRRRERLQRYHSPAVVDRILSTDTESTAFDTQTRDVTIMFADIVGFTTLSEGLDPAEVAATLNAFLTAMTDVIFANQGTLDKYIGDALLAVFGAPLPQANHAMSAVQAAVEMRRTLRAMNADGAMRPLEMRVALHSGRALTGDIGSPKRREFTVLGDVVNIASRIESSVAQPGQIVVTRDTLEQSGGGFRSTPLGVFTLRGRQGSVEAFAIED